MFTTFSTTTTKRELLAFCKNNKVAGYSAASKQGKAELLAYVNEWIALQNFLATPVVGLEYLKEQSVETVDTEVEAAVAESWTDYEQSSSVGDFSDVPDLEPHELDKLAERYGFPAVTAAHAVALFLVVMCTLVLWAIDAPVVIYRTVHAVWHAASNFYNGLVDVVVESYALVEFPALVEFL